MKRMKIKLFSDYELHIVPASALEPCEVYLYLRSAGFRGVMSGWGDGRYPELLCMPKRKMRKDICGTLAMCLAQYEYVQGKHLIFTAGMEYDLDRVVSEISEGSRALRNWLFVESGSGLLAVEGLWVFIYLSVDANLPEDRILEDILEFSRKNVNSSIAREAKSIDIADLADVIGVVKRLRAGSC